MQTSDDADLDAAEYSPPDDDTTTSVAYRSSLVDRVWAGLAGWSPERDPTMSTGGGVAGTGTGTGFGSIELRRSIARERFSAVFSTLKTTTYQDPGSRGPSSHSSVYPHSQPQLFLFTYVD